MKKVIVLLICWQATICHAQSIDTASQMAAFYFKEAEIAAKNQKIWPVQLYGPMLFVEAQSRITYANMPDIAGILKPNGEIYKGVLPKDLIVANTAINWQGKVWSVVLWPLPKDREERLNLVLHESFHRIQDQLRLPASNRAAEHLSTLDGRVYFLLELYALKSALSKPINKRKADLANALLFRAQRKELFQESYNNEKLLEMNEGLAEYTGVMIGRSKDSISRHLYNVIANAAEHKSLIRSFPYITGPVYGYLLFQKNPQWNIKIDSNSNFPDLIVMNYHMKSPQKASAVTIAGNIDRYHGKSIIRSEKLKEEGRLKLYNDYIFRFIQQPVLTIKLLNMNIGFDPTNLFDLGEYGTIYPTVRIKDEWGELIVTDNGMLMKDWQVITLEASQGITINGQILDGRGWQISLNPRWEIMKADAMHFKLVHKD